MWRLSEDLTGHESVGGDWDLEFEFGVVEAETAFTTGIEVGWHHLLDLTAVGSETLANATTTGTQSTAPFGGDNVAMDADGNYVVVWEDNRAGNLDVYARVYNADGSARTGDLLVNTFTSNAQEYAAVAMDSDGDFVVTWSSQLQDGSGYGVYFQRFDADGVKLGAETRVNSTTSGEQDLSSIGIADDGSFVVTFSDLSLNAGDVFAQRYNSTGNALGGNFRVNTTTANTQYYSSVDVDSDGDFVVVWEANGQDGGGWGIYGQRYDSSGVAQGSEFRVNTTTAGNQRGATVDMAVDGSFVVAWDSAGQDGSGTGVYAQRYDASGAALGGEISVNTTTTGDQDTPSIDVANDGRFLIAWQSNGQDGNLEGTFAQEFESSGATIGTEFRVNTTTGGNQHYSSVAYDGGQAVVAWSGAGNGDAAGVFTQQFSIHNRLVITTTSDVADGDTSSITALLANRGSDGFISLREAIEAANNTANVDAFTPDEIWFGISTSDSGYVDPDAVPGSGDEYWVITPESYLGDILDPVIIDATTQSSYVDKPVIDLDGSHPLNTGATAALNLRTSDSIIRGFAIHSFADDGIELDGTLTAGVAANNLIEYNWIGIDAEGNAGGVGDDGVLITDGASNNTLRYNVIADNGGDGILIRENLIAGTSGNLIYGNYIGTDPSGTSDMGNAGYGIHIIDAFDNTIGSSVVAERNVISGNDLSGISISGSLSTGNIVLGNYIGTNAAGTNAIGNTDDGIRILGGANNNTIGGDRTGGEGNVISGNLDDGIEILNAGADNNLIYGNLIGTDYTGTVDLGNARHGVVLYDGVQGNQVGGTGTGQGNIISGNDDTGIVIDGNGLATTTANIVAGNYIGLDIAGTTALGNSTNGVEIFGSASGNTVGGLSAAAGNVISGQGQYGIVISGAGGNTVRRNSVGTDASGTTAIGNGTDGIWVFQSDNTIIGGIGVGNVIAGSADSGIEIGNSTGVIIQGNFVGTDTMAVLDLGNSGSGIVLFGTSSLNVIGGTAAGAGNVVAHSGNDGIYLNDSVGTGNSILGNSVYDSGGLGIELTETGPTWGVTTNDAGDADTGANNLQNFPVITSAVTNGSQITVSGAINSTPNSFFRVEFFANTANNPSNHGEGQRFLGFANLSTDGAGNATINATLNASVAAGELVSATSTKTNAGFTAFTDTSEFAQNVAAAAGSSPGTAIWRNSGDSTPDANDWNGIDFLGAGNSASLGQLRIVDAAEAPSRDEIIAIGVDTIGLLRGEMWDGTSWTILPFALPPSLDNTAQNFDVAYESNSGNAVLVWDNVSGGTASVSYRVWDGISWSAEATITAPDAGIATELRLAANPNSDEMVLIVSDDNTDEWAAVWDGSSWGNTVVLDTATTGNRNEIAVSFESQSGNAMVIYDGIDNYNDLNYQTWDGTAWSGPQTLTLPFNGAAETDSRFTTIAADPTSDRIAIGVVTTGTENQVVFAVWDGAAWGNKLMATNSLYTGISPVAAVGFESQSGDLLVTYGEVCDHAAVSNLVQRERLVGRNEHAGYRRFCDGDDDGIRSAHRRADVGDPGQ